MADNKQLLSDFVATAYKDGDVNSAISKFPELKDYDKGLLSDFVATAYKDGDVNSALTKFPEFHKNSFDLNQFLPTKEERQQKDNGFTPPSLTNIYFTPEIKPKATKQTDPVSIASNQYTPRKGQIDSTEINAPVVEIPRSGFEKQETIPLNQKPFEIPAMYGNNQTIHPDTKTGAFTPEIAAGMRGETNPIKPLNEEEKNSFVFDLVEKFNQGGANVGKNSAGFLQKIYGGLKNIPIPGAEWYYGKAEDAMAAVSKYFGSVEKEMQKTTDRYKGKDFSDLAGEGKYSETMGDIMLNATQSLPQSLEIMFMGPVGVGMGAAQMQNEQYDQLEGKKMSEVARATNSILNAAIQTGTEYMNTIPMGKLMKGLATKLGKKEATTLLENGTRTWLQKMFKRYGVYVSPVNEGIEEFVSQIGTNTVDYLTGATKEFKPFEGAGKSFVYGAGGGLQFSAVGVPMQIASNVKAKQQYTFADNTLNDILITGGFNPQEATEIKQSLLSTTGEERNNAIVSTASLIPDAIVNENGTSKIKPEIAKAFVDFYNASDNLQETSSKHEKRIQKEKERQDIESENFIQSEQSTPQKPNSEDILQEATQNAQSFVSSITHAESGNVIEARLRGVEQPINITKGNVVLKEDGSVDTENSDKTFFYKTTDGRLHVGNIDFIENITGIVPAQEAIDKSIQPVREQLENDNAPEYGIGNTVVITDNTDPQNPTNAVVKITGRDENGNYQVQRDLGNGQVQPGIVQPREILPQFAGVLDAENAAVDYIDPETGETRTGILELDTPDKQMMFANGYATIDGKQIGFENVIKSQEPRAKSQDMTAELSNADLNINTNNNETNGLQATQATDTQAELGQGGDGTAVANFENQEPRTKNQEAEVIPQDEKGNLLFEQAKPELTIQFLKDNFEKEEIVPTVEARINAINKEISKQETFKPSGNIQKDALTKQAKRQALTALNEQLGYWKDIQERVTPRNYKPQNENITQRNNRWGEPVSLREMIIRKFIGGLKLKWDDETSENGTVISRGLGGEYRYSNDERTLHFNFISSNGVTPEQLAHEIWQANAYESGQFEDMPLYGMDTQDILNEILDVMNSYRSIGDMIKSVDDIRDQFTQQEQAYIDSLENDAENENNVVSILENEPDNSIFAQLAGVLDLTEEQYTELQNIQNDVTNTGTTETVIGSDNTDGSSQPGEAVTGNETAVTGRTVDEGGNQSGDRGVETVDQSAVNSQQSGIVYKRLSEPGKPLSEMNSDEIYQLAVENKKLLKEQDKLFEGKTEAEKELGGYYNAIDDISELKDTSTKLNFVENAEDLSELTISAKSVLDEIQNKLPNQYQSAILNGIQKRSNELGISTNDLIASVAKKIASQYADSNDAVTMVSSLFDKIATGNQSGYKGLEEVNKSAESQITPPPTGTPLEKRGESGDQAQRDTEELDAYIAEQEHNTNPTEKQKETGIYAKARVSLQGHNVTIETLKGTERSGIDEGGQKWSVILQNHYGELDGTVGYDGEPIDVFIGNNPKEGQIFVVDQLKPTKTPTWNDMIGQTVNYGGREVKITGLPVLKVNSYYELPGIDNVGETLIRFAKDEYEDSFLLNQKATAPSFDESKVMLGFDSAEEAKAAYMSNYEEGWDGFGAITPAGEKFKAWLYDGKKQRKPFSEYVDTPSAVDNESLPKQEISQPQKTEKNFVEVKSNKDVSKVFNRLLKDEIESEDYGIHGLLADWGAVYNPYTEKLEFNETRSGTGIMRLSKKDFINDILNGKLEKEIPSIKDYISGLKEIIYNELGISSPKQETLNTENEQKLSKTNQSINDNQIIDENKSVESLQKSEQQKEPSYKNGDTVTYKGEELTINGVGNDDDGTVIYDLENERGKTVYGDVPENELTGEKTHPLKKGENQQRKAASQNPSASSEPKPEKIEDFGEKIEGARKDQLRKYYNKINLNGLTLSTIFPKPDIKNLLESGLSVRESSAIKVAYEFAESQKKRYKQNKDRQIGGIKFCAAYAKTLLSENLNIEFKNEGWMFTEVGKKELELRVAAYEKIAQELGNDYLNLDLSKVKITELTPEYTRWMVRKPEENEKYEVQYYVNPTKRFATLDEALDEFVKQVKENTKTDVVTYKRKLNVYNDSKGNGAFIGYQPSGKPVIRLKEGFKTGREAFDYRKEFEADLHTMLERILAENKAETKKTVTRLKYTNETARERVGKDWREGKDVSTENFANRFGFRGVEYGNWVNQKERQVFLNNTYDSLMDLAQIIGVSPEAISLNGRLALSFGSRGSGGASAHYEPERTIINLTKTKGLGSLAHEWFHAVDNYFADFKVSANGMKSATMSQFKEGTRTEVQQAFRNLYDAFASEYKQRSRMLDMDKSKNYFSLPHEMAARAFENYILNKTKGAGQTNDFLANYVSPEDWKGEPNKYPYPIGEESKQISEAFDNLFETIQEDDKHVLYQSTEKQLEPATEKEVADLTARLLSTGLAKEVRMVTPEEMTGILEGNEKYQAKLPDTITIDGVERPTVNSNGKLIHSTEEGVRNFWKWFGESKVIDESGRPLVVYHGSSANFNEFKLSKEKGNNGEDDQLQGIYFTDNKNGAEWFSLVENDDKFLKEVYLSLQNPYTVEGKKELKEEIGKDKLGDISDIVKNKGNDGLIINRGFYAKGGPYREIIAFDPSQIKSATSNNGEFDSNSTNIRYFRKPDGTIYGFVKDGIVYLNSDKPNLNTPIHEFGHLFTPILKAEHREFYDKGVELIKASPYYENVKSDANYSHLDEDGIIDEALNQAIGDKGAKAVKDYGLYARLKQWIKGVWERIGAKFGIKNMTSEQIQNLTLNDWTDVVNSELLNPQPPKGDLKSATINIDGVERSTTNNLGKPIYSTEEGIRNFWKWFGDSKVVDESGRPLVVYHATQENFNSFSKEKQGTSIDFGTLGTGFYFTAEKENANNYARNLNTNTGYEGNESIMPVYLNIRNPKRTSLIQVSGRNKSESDKFTNTYLKKGFDGVKGQGTQSLLWYVVPDPTQIKSAIGNDGTFDPDNSDIRYQVIGEKGASVLDKTEEATTRLDNLRVAKEMEDNKTPQEIRLATGWEKGVDGLWRYEVADGELAFGYYDLIQKGGMKRLSDVFENSEIFKAYPELNNVAVMTDNLGDISGSYSNKVITLNRDKFGKVDMLSVLIHEIQHAIQDIEGFAKGGSIGTSNIGIQKLNSFLNDNPQFKEYNDVVEKMSKSDDESLFLKSIELSSKLDKDLMNEYSKLLTKTLGFNEYWNLAGETEARNASARMNFTPEERQQRLLSETADVAPEDQIVIMDGMGVSNLTPNPSASLVPLERGQSGKYKGSRTTTEFYAQVKSLDELAGIGKPVHDKKGGELISDYYKRVKAWSVANNPQAWGEQDRQEVAEFIAGITPESYEAKAQKAQAAAQAAGATVVDEPKPVFQQDGHTTEDISAFARRVVAWREQRFINGIVRAEREAEAIEAAERGETPIDHEIARMELDMQLRTVYDSLGNLIGKQRAKKLERWAGNKEMWADNLLPVKTFLDFMRSKGMKIPDIDDYYMQATALQGKNDTGFNDYVRRYQKPVNKWIHDTIKKTGFNYRDVENYVFLKHGVERNEFFKKDGKHQKADYAGVYAIASELYAKDNGIPFDPKEKNEIGNVLKEYANANGITLKETSESGIYDELFANKKDVIDQAAVEKNRAFFDKIINETINNFESESNAKGRSIDDLWEKLNAANDFSLNTMADGGIITRTMADEIKSRYKYFIPLRGHEVEAEKTYEYSPDAGVFFSNPAIKAHGRITRAENPFSYVAQMAQSAVVMKNKNDLNKTLLRLARRDKTGLFSVNKTWYIKTRSDAEGNDIWEEAELEAKPSDELNRAEWEAWNERMKELEKEGRAKQFTKGVDLDGLFIKKKQKKQHAITIIENGEEYQIYINANPRISRAVNGLNKSEQDRVLRFLSATKGMIGRNLTSRNPAFMAANFSRDVIFASSILPAKEGGVYTAKFLSNIPVAAKEMIQYHINPDTAPQYVREFFENGGETGYSHLWELQDMQKKIDKAVAQGMSVGKAWDALMMPIDVMNKIVENTTRMAVYKTSRESGRTIERSISDSKEVTLNFNRTGAGGGITDYVRSSYLFVNAAVQALNNFTKVYKEHPVKMTGVVMGYVMSGLLMSLINAVAGDDDEYWNLPDYDRQNNLCIWTGNGFIKIPLPQELRVFHRMGDNIAAYLWNKKPMGKAMVDTGAGLLDLIPANPSGAASVSTVELVPDAFKPFAQVYWSNKSFTGAAIAKDPAFMKEGVPQWRQVRTNRANEPKAPAGIIWLSAELNAALGGDQYRSAGTFEKEVLNPDRLNHLARGYFGGLYTTATQGLGTITDRFYLNEKDLNEKTTGGNLQNAYNKIDDAEKRVNQFNTIVNDLKEGKIDRVQFAKDTVGTNFGAAKKIQKLGNRLRDINKTIKENQDLPEEEKKQLLEAQKTILKLVEETTLEPVNSYQ